MVKRDASEKKQMKHSSSKKTKNMQVDKILVENFVSLQKVMTNLATKFDDLSSQISKLLQLFEISAKTLAEKDYSKNEGNKKMEGKLDALLEHNKIIAKGIALLHEKGMPEEKEVVIMPRQQQIPPQPVQQPAPARPPMPGQNIPRTVPARPMQQTQQYTKPPQEFSKVKYTKEE